MKHFHKYILYFIYFSLPITMLANENNRPSFTNNWLNTNPSVGNPSNCDLAITIPDLSCFLGGLSIEIDALGLTGTSLGNDIYLKEVRLIIEHTWLSDVDIYLRAPSGIAVEISTDNGGSDDNYGNPNNGLCNEFTSFISAGFSNCNLTNIVDGTAPFIGEYLPEGNFADFHDGTDPNGKWFLEICDDGGVHEGTVEYVELVFETAVCATPSAIQVTSIDSTSVTIDWISGNVGANTFIEYGLSGFSPGNGMVLSNISSPYTISLLMPANQYDFYLYEDCGVGNTSSFSCINHFTTTCSPGAPTLLEDFDAEQLCLPFCGVPCNLNGIFKNILIDDADWLVDNNGTISSGTGPSSDVSTTGNFVYLEASGGACQSGKQVILESELILVSAKGDGCDMSFNYHAFGANIGNLTIQVSNDCGNSWDMLFSVNGAQGNQWNFEYLDLAAYDGQTVIFQFIANGNNGFSGDLAIDEIAFYGAQLATAGAQVYYLDNDADGFGDENNSINSCDVLPPSGYVSQFGDCDDTNANINPNAIEIPCDGIDNNCNGMGDDDFLFQPITINDTICMGESANLRAIPQSANGFIEWFENQNDAVPIFTGNNYSPGGINSISVSSPMTITYWAQEKEGVLCASARVPVTLTIFPFPILVSQNPPAQCANVSVNLLDYVVDINNIASTQICYHANGTVLPNCLVTPSDTTTYLVEYINAGECKDDIQLTINVLETPEAQIEGAIQICQGTSDFLTVIDSGNGLSPLTYSWSNNSSSSFSQIFGNSIVGTFDNYSVTVTGANDCADVDNYSVQTQANISNVTTEIQDVTICDGQDGAIKLGINGGTPPYLIEWTGQETGQEMIMNNQYIIPTLAQGQYQVRITEDNGLGCSRSLPTLFVNGPAATIQNLQVIAPSCVDAADGEISIEVTGVNPIVIWNTGAQSDTIRNLVSGQYSVTVFDGNCTNEIDIPLLAPDPITGAIIVEDVSCFGNADGTLTALATGGTGDLDYHWSTGDDTPLLSTLAAADYQLTITDENNCTLNLSTNISVPTNIGVSSKTVQQIECSGDQTGLINLQLTGGTTPYQMDWSNGQTGFQIQNLAAATYITTITDRNGCTLLDTTTINNIEPLSSDLSPIDPSCKGLSDGSIDATFEGGTGTYQYSWNNGANTQDLNSLGAGQYVLTVTDANNCSLATDTIILIEKELLAITSNLKDPTCNGVDDGMIELSFADSIDVNTLSFHWDNGGMTQDLMGLPAGGYTVTITDEDNCKVDSTFQLTSDSPITVNTSLINASCFGENNGSITLGITGSHPPFDILWNTNDTTPSIDELAPGTYTAAITDDLNCELVTDALLIIENQDIQIFENQVEDNPCQGEALGSIDITVTGGAGGYQYQWSNGSNQEDPNNLPAGTYEVTITDAENCVKISKNFVVLEPDSFFVTTNLAPFSDCEENIVDSICLFVSGATPPYQYLWNDGFTGSCYQNPAVGDYSVTITDAFGCTKRLEALKVPEPIATLAFEYPDGDTISTLCAGGGGVPFPVNIVGGSKPYQYLWSHGEQGTVQNDTLIVSGLEPGICNVTITDDAGCVIVSDSVEVINVEPVFLFFEKKDIRCKGIMDGEIQIFPTGGTPPYNYFWFDNLGTPIDTTNFGFIDTFGVGDYSVTVFDQNNCQASVGEIPIREPAEFLTLETIEILDPVCFGDENGQISYVPAGGSEPYQYLWNTTDTTQKLLNLAAGIYELTMTDANECILQQSFIINNPNAPLSITDAASQDVLCYGEKSGQIQLTVNGGWGGYEYNWTPAISTQEDLIGIPAGEYSVIIFDERGCATQDSQFVISQPDSIFINAIKNDTPAGQSNGSISIEITGGAGNYDIMWSTGDIVADIENLPIGIYTVTVTDQEGCTAEKSIQINSTTGTQNLNLVDSYQVFPNPTNGNLNIDLTLSKSIDVDIQLVDILGQTVHHARTNNFHKGQLSIDTRGLPAATYWLFIFGEDDRLLMEKIVVNY